ncbi:hypothetical protein VTK73DRAFT_9455 [Phialemonium thermophilum]|uniref:Ubiquitin interaction domain-containing protein n=1 Tax=Phialemonium thermophilum TaxID=223376 RepID=A0ABR3W291_9PEZI
MVAPSDEDVATVLSILGLDQTDHLLVTSALQAKNNNIEQVVNEYFDNPEKFHRQYTWDETAFAADDGGPHEDQLPSFSIHPPDNTEVLHGVDANYYNSGAPSRPPSRANSRSPLSKLVDFTGQSAQLPTTSAQEDADIQRAIAESVVTSGMHTPQPLAQGPPQESGVIQVDPSIPYFGPANRPEYAQDQWALVTVNRESPEPGPSARKRKPGVPAFLRCRSDKPWGKHRLGGLLTVFHAIPSARNALLRCGTPAESYGHDAAWWKGAPILRPGAVASQGVGESEWAEDAQPDWAEELHRLMAFLDGTERSYGTADVLAEAKPQGTVSSGDTEKDFFEYVTDDDGRSQTTSALIAATEIVDVCGEGHSHVKRWALLEPSFTQQQALSMDSLYQMLDAIFYIDRNMPLESQSTTMAMLTHAPEVLTMRFNVDSGLPRRIDIPRVLYVDRYLESRKDELMQIYRDMWGLLDLTAKSRREEERLKKVFLPKIGREYDVVDLLHRAIRWNEQGLHKLKALARWRLHEEARARGDDSIFLPMSVDDREVSYNEDEAQKKQSMERNIRIFRAKLAGIERQLKGVLATRRRIERAMRNLDTFLTTPSQEERWNPTHPYTLRGVVPSVDVCYVCVRDEPDLIEFDGSAETTAPKEQWWKLGYVSSDEAPIKAEETTYEKVMEEACGVGSMPILIYASEEAMQAKPEPLSEALQTFVRFDNRLFAQELKDETPPDRKRAGFASPSSPPKRRNRSSSLDSMATNAASAGDLDDDMRDAQFELDEPYQAGAAVATSSDDRNNNNNNKPPMYGAPQELVDTSLPDDMTSATVSGTRSRTLSPDPDAFSGASHSLPQMQMPRGGEFDAALRRLSAQAEESEAQQEQQQHPRAPEMQERGGASPFFLQPASRKQSSGPSSSVMDLEMED